MLAPCRIERGDGDVVNGRMLEEMTSCVPIDDGPASTISDRKVSGSLELGLRRYSLNV